MDKAVKEYGGYIEFEKFHGKMLHDSAVALNCGRNALAYICEAKHMTKLFLPYLICSSVTTLCEKIGLEYEYYHIDESFRPVFDITLKDNEWLYIVNYYGQLDNEYIIQCKKKNARIIVDNSQSYYQMPVVYEDGVIDTIYTCRKYFGVADGAFLYTDSTLEREFETDESFARMNYLLGRYERTANEFYSEYVANNQMFGSEDIKKMSSLTYNILHGLDYERIARQRQENFDYLNDKFRDVNALHLNSVYGAYMYPLLVSNGAEYRKLLQERKIYIPVLWPNVLKECDAGSMEYHYACDILPIPVDQRYDSKDMQDLAEIITDVLS